MTVKEFNETYGKKQGLLMLTQMRSLSNTQDMIANHFGVSKERVRQWMLEFFGSEYDPRQERRDRMMNSMIDFARNHEIEDFKEAYNGSEYYNEVLKECNNQKIYVQKD